MLVLILGVMVWIILCALHGGPLGSAPFELALVVAGRDGTELL